MKAIRTIIARILSVRKEIRIVRVIFALLATVTLTITNPASAADLSSGMQQKLDEIEAKGEAGRPRTPRQWEAEARELEGQPIERFKTIVGESVEAVGEMVEVYPSALNPDANREDEKANAQEEVVN